MPKIGKKPSFPALVICAGIAPEWGRGIERKDRGMSNYQLSMNNGRLRRTVQRLRTIIFFFLLSSCELFSGPKVDLFEQISDEVDYAAAPWVPLRIETNGLGITSPAPQAHDKLVKLGYSFKLVIVPDTGYPFRGWQAWVQDEGIRSFWKNDPDEQDAAYHPERVRFVPLNTSGTEVEIFVHEMPPEGKRLVIGPWGATNDELTVLPDSGRLGNIQPSARLSGVKLDFPFTVSFQPSSAYPFRGWQAKFMNGDKTVAESVWTVESENAEPNGILWSPRNVSGLEMSVTIVDLPENFPTDGSIIIGPLGADSPALIVETSNGEGLGTVSPITSPVRQSYPFTISFQPSSAYPFRGWQAQFISGNDDTVTSVWTVESGNTEHRENGILWSSRNASGLEMSVTIEDLPEGFSPNTDSIVIGPLGMDSKSLRVETTNGEGLGTISTITSSVRQGYPFAVSFQPSAAYPFKGWQAKFYNGNNIEMKFYDEDNIEIATVWNTESEEQKVNGVLWSPKNVSGLEMNVTIETLPANFPTDGSILIGPLGMGNDPANVRIAASIAWGVTNPSGALSDRRIDFPFNVEFTVSSAWAFEEWKAFTDTGAGWNVAAPGTALSAEAVTIQAPEAGRTEVTVHTTSPVVLVPWCNKRPEVVSTNLPGHFFDRKATNYPVIIWFNLEIDEACLTWDNFIISAKTDRGRGQTLAGNAITKYFQLPVIDEYNRNLVAIYRNSSTFIRNESTIIDDPEFNFLDITIELNFDGIKSKATMTPMGEQGQSQQLLYGVSGEMISDSPIVLNLMAETGVADSQISMISGAVTPDNVSPTEKQYYVKNNNGERGIYFLFDKNELDDSVDPFGFTNISITEMREDAPGSPPLEGIASRIASSSDDMRFDDLMTAYKAQNANKEPYIYRYNLLNTTEGTIQLAVQPINFFGVRETFANAKKVRVILDTTPPPETVSNVSADYNAGTITFTWENPNSTPDDFEGILISWNGGADILKPNSETSHTLTFTQPYRNSYTFSFSTVDFARNSSSLLSQTYYAVTFNNNSGTPAPAEQYILSGGTATQPMEITRDGYTFADWYKEANFTTQWDFNTAVTAYTPLHARFYSTITFDANGATGGAAPAAVQVNAGSSTTLPAASAGMTKTGYTFGGWNTQADDTGTNYNANTSFTPDGDITLYARWNYTVTFNINGGTGTAPAAQAVNPGGTTTLPGNTGFSRTGYTFSGWNTNSSGTGTNYTAGDSYEPSSAAVTLYAKWTANTYTISYLDVGGGTFSGTHGTNPPASHTYGSATSLVSPSTGIGYIFGGWYINSDGTGTALTSLAATGYTANITLYARWVSPTPLSNGTWVDGSITSTSSSVWYSLDVTTGTTYYVWWNDSYEGNGSKTLDVRVSAYYSSGTNIFNRIDSGWNSPRSFTAGSSGTLYIQVEAYSGGGYTGTFATAYTTDSTTPGYGNNVTPLTASSYIYSALTSTTTAAWYSFNVTKNTTYYVHWLDSDRSEGLSGTMDVKVAAYYLDGSVIFDGDYNDSNYHSFTAVRAGTVRIKVYPYGSSRGNFAVTYSTGSSRPSVATGTPTSPIPLTAGTWSGGNITSVGGVYWYWFNVTANTTYYIWWRDSTLADGLSGLMDVCAAAYFNSPAAAHIFAVESTWNNGVNSARYTPTSNGTVYVKIFNDLPSGSGGSKTGPFYVTYSTSNSRP